MGLVTGASGVCWLDSSLTRHSMRCCCMYWSPADYELPAGGQFDWTAAPRRVPHGSVSAGEHGLALVAPFSAHGCTTEALLLVGLGRLLECLCLPLVDVVWSRRSGRLGRELLGAVISCTLLECPHDGIICKLSLVECSGC